MTHDLTAALTLAFILGFVALVAGCFAYDRGYKAGLTDGRRAVARWIPGQR